LAEAAGRAGGTTPAVLNGANEEAVEAFLDGRLSFLGVADVVEECLTRLSGETGRLRVIEDALEADRRGRELARSLIKKLT
jgi:1-deoxy-D-xylulose-5-phosphate reductoisomerase